MESVCRLVRIAYDNLGFFASCIAAKIPNCIHIILSPNTSDRMRRDTSRVHGLYGYKYAHVNNTVISRLIICS